MDGMKLRIAVCDDREEDMEQAAATLQKCLHSVPHRAVVSIWKFLGGEKLCSAHKKEPFDLVFLGIGMPGTEMFRLAGTLCPNRPRTYLVFVSEHEEYVFDSMEYMPLWFVRRRMLERDMKRALGRYFQETEEIYATYKLKAGYGSHVLAPRDILYIEGTGHRLKVCRTDGRQLEKYGSLVTMEKKLEGRRFLRIHKNYLVNMAYIREVGKQEVYLTGGTVLDMGRDRRKAVLEAVWRYEKEYHGWCDEPPAPPDGGGKSRKQ